MVKPLCKIVGVVMLLVGVLGFFAPTLLGMHLTPIHNLVHLASASAALYFGFAASAGAARGFALAFGGLYLLLGVLGFVAPGVVAAVIGHPPADAGSLLPDNVVHVLLGGVFLAAALLQAPTRVAMAR